MSSRKLFPQSDCPVIGMIHVAALPGTPANTFAPNAIIDLALEEAQTYLDNGIEGLMIENMHDIPYLNRSVGPEIVAVMSILAGAIRQMTDLPCGLQILAGANQEALAVAHAANFDFIRAEGFVFGHMADEGFMQSDAGTLLRYRKQIGAEQVKVFTDIKKKHSSHAITADTGIVETAKAASFFYSDGLIITGAATGETTSLDEIRAVRQSVDSPILVGSGINSENVKDYVEVADALIIGSYFKEAGNWQNGVDPERIKRLLDARYARKSN